MKSSPKSVFLLSSASNLIWIAVLGFILHLGAIQAFSQATANSPVLSDNDQNGTITLVAIGDSLTAGLGDGIPPGAEVVELEGTEFGEAYVGRLSRYLGVPIENEGIPGEELLKGGIARFPSELNSSKADVALLFEGLNDALFRANPSEYGRVIQRAANVSRALGKNLVLLTLPVPCCNRAGRDIFVNSYSDQIRAVASANSVVVADIAKAWDTTCQNPEECELFNLPEGLHPNTLGHDVIAQTIAASILDIDIFAPDGAQKLAGAIGLPLSDIKVKPAAVVPTPIAISPVLVN